MQQLSFWIDVGLLVTGGAIALGWVLAALRRERDPLRGSPLRPNRLGPVAVWICLTAYLLGGAIGASLGRRSAPSGISDEALQLWESATGTGDAGLFSIMACLIVAKVAFRGGWRGLGLARRSPFLDLLVAIPVCLASIAATTGVAWVTERLMTILKPSFKPPEHSVFVILHDSGMPAHIRMLAFWGALVLAPITEELLFRGILQSAVRRVIPLKSHSMRHRWVAIAVVSVLFGAMHSPTPQHIPALMVFGAILGYLYERTGSLVLPMFVHMLFNGKSLIWDLLFR